MRIGISTSCFEQSIAGCSARNSARLTSTKVLSPEAVRRHDIGLEGQQHLVSVVPGFERIVGRLSAYTVLKVGARRDTADFELRQQAGSDIGPGNAGHFDRQIVVGADEGHEGGPIPLFSGESGHRDRHRCIVERVVARRSARVHIIRVGETDRIETSGRKIHGLRVVRVAQTHHPVIAGREGRQLRGAGRDLAKSATQLFIASKTYISTRQILSPNISVFPSPR